MNECYIEAGHSGRLLRGKASLKNTAAAANDGSDDGGGGVSIMHSTSPCPSTFPAPHLVTDASVAVLTAGGDTGAVATTQSRSATSAAVALLVTQDTKLPRRTQTPEGARDVDARSSVLSRKNDILLLSTVPY